MEACTRVRNKKAPDLDGIPNKALKAATKVGSYFTDWLLNYYRYTAPKDYIISGGVPQGSVLDPLKLALRRDVSWYMHIPWQ